MKLKSKRTKIIFLMFFIVICVSIFFVWQNNTVVVTNYNYINAKLPSDFEGCKIVQISDLHSKDFHGNLSKKIQEINPNFIVITGDLIDMKDTNTDVVDEFLAQITPIASVCFVTGNHEQLSKEYSELQETFKKYNVKVIDNSYVKLSKGFSVIGLIGLADPAIQQKESDTVYIEKNLKVVMQQSSTDFNILLSHRPELFSIYKTAKVDLVFSGHAHGGQIRLPFIGGLVSPNQGYLPKYTSGIYSQGATSMVVSRGLGNSIFPLRIFNPPELVVVTLKGVK